MHTAPDSHALVVIQTAMVGENGSVAELEMVIPWFSIGDDVCFSPGFRGQ